MALGGGEVEPLVRLDEVAFDAMAVGREGALGLLARAVDPRAADLHVVLRQEVRADIEAGHVPDAAARRVPPAPRG